MLSVLFVVLLVARLCETQVSKDFVSPKFGERWALCEACYGNQKKIFYCRARFVRCVRKWTSPTTADPTGGRISSKSLLRFDQFNHQLDDGISQKIKKINLPRNKNVFGKKAQTAVAVLPPPDQSSIQGGVVLKFQLFVINKQSTFVRIFNASFTGSGGPEAAVEYMRRDAILRQVALFNYTRVDTPKARATFQCVGFRHVLKTNDACKKRLGSRFLINAEGLAEELEQQLVTIAKEQKQDIPSLNITSEITVALTPSPTPSSSTNTMNSQSPSASVTSMPTIPSISPSPASSTILSPSPTVTPSVIQSVSTTPSSTSMTSTSASVSMITITTTTTTPSTSTSFETSAPSMSATSSFNAAPSTSITSSQTPSVSTFTTRVASSHSSVPSISLSPSSSVVSSTTSSSPVPTDNTISPSTSSTMTSTSTSTATPTPTALTSTSASSSISIAVALSPTSSESPSSSMSSSNNLVTSTATAPLSGTVTLSVSSTPITTNISRTTSSTPSSSSLSSSSPSTQHSMSSSSSIWLTPTFSTSRIRFTDRVQEERNQNAFRRRRRRMKVSDDEEAFIQVKIRNVKNPTRGRTNNAARITIVSNKFIRKKIIEDALRKLRARPTWGDVFTPKRTKIAIRKVARKLFVVIIPFKRRFTLEY